MRPSRPKSSAKAGAKMPPSPLDAKKRELAETDARIKAEIARQEKVIAEAPRLAAEQKRQKREEFVRHISRTEARFGKRGNPTLADPRFPYELNVSVAAKQKTLRIHRNQGMLKFFILCLILAGVVCWVYFVVIRPS